MKEKDRHSNEEANEAAAIKYDAQNDAAPRITALGKGYVAQRMIQAAREKSVQVVKDKGVSAVLHKLNVGDEIPEQLYKAVAQILVFVYSIDSERKSKAAAGKSYNK